MHLHQQKCLGQNCWNSFFVLSCYYSKSLQYRSTRPEVFLGKGILKICSKLAGEHPCRSGISTKLLCNIIEITHWHGCSPVNLLHIFKAPFPKNTSRRLLLTAVHTKPFSSHKGSRSHVLQNRHSWKFCGIHRKTLVLESVFNTVTDLQDCNFIKKRLQHMCFPVNIATFVRIIFLKNASGFWSQDTVLYRKFLAMLKIRSCYGFSKTIFK